MRLRTVPKIDIDEGLVWDSGLLTQLFEIGNGGLVQSYRYLFLEGLGVGIPRRLGEIIALPHLSSVLHRLASLS